MAQIFWVSVRTLSQLGELDLLPTKNAGELECRNLTPGDSEITV